MSAEFRLRPRGSLGRNLRIWRLSRRGAVGWRRKKSPLEDAEASRAAGGKGHGWFAILLRNLRRAQRRVRRRSVCTVIAARADSRRRQWPSDDPGRASLRVLSKANSLNATSPVFVVLSLGISYPRTHSTNLVCVSTHQFCAGFARISRVDSSQFGSDQFSSVHRSAKLVQPPLVAAVEQQCAPRGAEHIFQLGCRESVTRTEAMTAECYRTTPLPQAAQSGTNSRRG